MRLPLPQLTTCMLILHLAMGCCWHHAHGGNTSGGCSSCRQTHAGRNSCGHDGGTHQACHVGCAEAGIQVSGDQAVGNVAGQRSDSDCGCESSHPYGRSRNDLTSCTSYCESSAAAKVGEFGADLSPSILHLHDDACIPADAVPGGTKPAEDSSSQDQEQRSCSEDTCQYVVTEPFSVNKTSFRAWSGEAYLPLPTCITTGQSRIATILSEVRCEPCGSGLRRHLLCSVLLL